MWPAEHEIRSDITSILNVGQSLELLALSLAMQDVMFRTAEIYGTYIEKTSKLS